MFELVELSDRGLTRSIVTAPAPFAPPPPPAHNSAPQTNTSPETPLLQRSGPGHARARTPRVPILIPTPFVPLCTPGSLAHRARSPVFRIPPGRTRAQAGASSPNCGRPRLFLEPPPPPQHPLPAARVPVGPVVPVRASVPALKRRGTRGGGLFAGRPGDPLGGRSASRVGRTDAWA